MSNQAPMQPESTCVPLDFALLTSRMNNNPKLAKMLFKKFTSSVRSVKSELPNSVARSNLEQIQHCAHKLKGSSLTAAAGAIADAATKLEDTAKAENLEQAGIHLSTLVREIDRFLEWSLSSPDLDSQLQK